MKTIDQWFLEYGESHQNSANKIIHYFCVPLITYSTLGLFDSLSRSLELSFSLAYLIVGLGGLFYLRLSLKLGLLLIFTTTLMVISFTLFESQHGRSFDGSVPLLHEANQLFEEIHFFLCFLLTQQCKEIFLQEALAVLNHCKS